MLDMPSKVERRNLLATGLGAAASFAVEALFRLMRNGTPGVLTAGRVPGDLPAEDPESELWASADELKVKLLPQQLFYPKLTAVTIADVALRALWNGTQLVLRFEWGINGGDDLEPTANFRDAVAAMVPLNPSDERPPVFMGVAGRPVYILQWRARWQRENSHGFHWADKSEPRWFNDAHSDTPTLTKLGMSEYLARTYSPVLPAGRNISHSSRTSPVAELTAEGFGTRTPLPEQRATGKGVYRSGRWKVSIAVPTGAADTPSLQAGMTVPLAMAVWDGAGRQSGGRKHYADWIQLTIPREG